MSNDVIKVIRLELEIERYNKEINNLVKTRELYVDALELKQNNDIEAFDQLCSLNREIDLNLTVEQLVNEIKQLRTNIAAIQNNSPDFNLEESKKIIKALKYNFNDDELFEYNKSKRDNKFLIGNIATDKINHFKIDDEFEFVRQKSKASILLNQIQECFKNLDFLKQELFEIKKEKDILENYYFLEIKNIKSNKILTNLEYIFIFASLATLIYNPYIACFLASCYVTLGTISFFEKDKRERKHMKDIINYNKKYKSLNVNHKTNDRIKELDEYIKEIVIRLYKEEETCAILEDNYKTLFENADKDVIQENNQEQIQKLIKLRDEMNEPSYFNKSEVHFVKSYK